MHVCIAWDVVLQSVFDIYLFLRHAAGSRGTYFASKMWSHPRKAVFGVNVAFFALSWITVSLRVVVRVGMLRAFGSDVSVHSMNAVDGSRCMY